MTRPGRACAARACSSSRRSLGSPSQALLTRQTLVDLIAMDRATHQPQLVIFRVWPDYPMYAQIDRSARTVSSKLRSWLLRPSHGGVEDPADAHLQQQLAATTQRATTDRHPPPRIGEREHGPSTVAPTLCKQGVRVRVPLAPPQFRRPSPLRRRAAFGLVEQLFAAVGLTSRTFRGSPELQECLARAR